MLDYCRKNACIMTVFYLGRCKCVEGVVTLR